MLGQEEQCIVKMASRATVQFAPSLAVSEVDNSVHAAVLKFGSKIGIWTSGISVAGVISILTGLNHSEKTSICDKILLAACLLPILTSFFSGGILLTFQLFHIQMFQPDDSQSTKKIKTIIGIAIGSMALVVISVAVIIVRRAP